MNLLMTFHKQNLLMLLLINFAVTGVKIEIIKTISVQSTFILHTHSFGKHFNNVPVTITDQITSSLADKNAHLHKPGFENFPMPSEANGASSCFAM